MILVRRQQRRGGAVTVEHCFVLPAALFLVFILIVGGMGVFRYQEMASLAREGARYASVHGAQYRKDAGLPTGTAADWQADIVTNGINPKCVSLNPNNLSVQVSWPPVINQPNKPDNWPGSEVTVTVQYKWFPEWYLIGPFTLTSTSEMIITN
jgi:Flp pilus assembly protein TadG